MQETDLFANTIAKVGLEVKQLEVPDELFASDAFVAIYERPSAYLAPAFTLIERNDTDAHPKKIIAYAMQKLPPEQFVEFITAVVASLEQGKTSVEVLETAAFPAFNWGNQTLVIHYQDPAVRALLRRILALPTLSQSSQAYIAEDIFTGKAKRNYLEYMDMLGRPIPQ